MDTDKIDRQVDKAGLPRGGSVPFRPQLSRNQRGDAIIVRRAVAKGPKADEKGFVDDLGRIWIRDYAHAGYPNHWDVQIDDGEGYFRVDENGEVLD